MGPYGTLPERQWRSQPLHGFKMRGTLKDQGRTLQRSCGRSCFSALTGVSREVMAVGRTSWTSKLPTLGCNEQCFD